MTTLLRSTAIAILGSAAFGLPSLAAEPAPASEQKAAGQHQLQQAALPPADDDRCWIRFTEIDADDDGSIDAAEAKRHQARVFEIDRNRDGAISRAEFADCVRATPAAPARGETAAAQTPEEMTFAALDTDKDGAVTLAEYMASAEKIWRAQTGQGGGMAMQAYAKSPLSLLSYDAATLDWDGDRTISPNEAAVDSWYNFVALDLNEDGRVSQEEWRDRKADKPGVPAAEMFALMDRNGDGRITAAESAETWDMASRQDGVDVEAVPVWVYQVYTVR